MTFLKLAHTFGDVGGLRRFVRDSFVTHSTTSGDLVSVEKFKNAKENLHGKI
jgi:hypothetical protein